MNAIVPFPRAQPRFDPMVMWERREATTGNLRIILKGRDANGTLVVDFPGLYSYKGWRIVFMRRLSNTLGFFVLETT